MKKKVLSLVVAALMLFLPVVALADMVIKPNIPNTPTSDVKNSDGTITKVYPIYLNIEDNTDNKSVNTADFEFQFGSAITKFDCKGTGNYTATATGTGSNAGKCSFTSETGSSDSKIQVGTIEVTVKADAKDEDCTIKYIANGITGTFNKTNPSTGASLPYEIIVGGIVLAAGAYFVTSRKTKLFKI